MTIEFIYPTRGNFSLEHSIVQPVNVYDILYFQWNSTWQQVWIGLFCYDSGNIWGQQYVSGCGTYEWGAIRNPSGNNPNISCAFQIRNAGGNSPAGQDTLNGESFSITTNAASSTTFQPDSTPSCSATTSTQSTQSTISSGKNAQSTISPDTTTQSTTSPRLSTGAIVGISMGAVVAFLTISALLLIIWWMNQKLQASRPTQHGGITKSARAPSEPLREQKSRSTQPSIVGFVNIS